MLTTTPVYDKAAYDESDLSLTANLPKIDLSALDEAAEEPKKAEKSKAEKPKAEEPATRTMIWTSKSWIWTI